MVFVRMFFEEWIPAFAGMMKSYVGGRCPQAVSKDDHFDLRRAGACLPPVDGGRKARHSGAANGGVSSEYIVL